VAAALLFVALALFGAKYHWLEETSGAERDGFVTQAERVMSGSWPNDPFRPPLYALLSAALGSVFGDAFVAARTISNLAASALAWCAFELGRKLHGTPAGAIAMALTIVNPNLWVFGQHAATDMLFAAIAAATLVGGLSYMLEPSARVAAWIGLGYGLAAFTRSNAVLLLPALVLVFFLSSRESSTHGTSSPRASDASSARSRPWHHLAFGLAGATAAMLPLWLIRFRVFGSPFYDENAKNLWWKLHGNLDWSLLDRAPRTSLSSLLIAEPMAVLRSTVTELVAFARWVLPELLGGWGMLALLAASAVMALRARRWPELYLLFFLTIFTLGLGVAFFVWDRFALVWLPVSAALCASLLVQLGSKASANMRWSVLALGLVAGALTVRRTAQRLPEFIARHPYAEVELLREVEPGLDQSARLAGTAPYLQRYFHHEYVELPDVFGVDAKDEAAYFARLAELLRTKRVAYLVVSKLELRERPRTLLVGQSPNLPAWLSPLRRTEQATLWRVAF
jgi:hypothetical protein